MTSTVQAPALAPAQHPSSAGDAELERAASEIIELLRRHARRHRGSAIWLGRKNDDTFSELPPDLYDGSGGIALTLALWGKTDNCAQSSRLALEAVLMPRRRLKALAANITKEGKREDLRLGGGFRGLGSAVYSYSRLALFLQDRELAADVLDLCRIMSPARIQRQQTAAIIDGVSGLLLALLTAHRAARHLELESSLEPSILACGDRLREFLDDPTHPCPPGFGHGLSGIAYALTRLHEEHPEGNWHWDGHAALAQERLLFDPRLRAWKKSLTQDQLVTENSWCEGPAGMLLARAAIVARDRYPQDPISATDLDVLTEQTRWLAARRRDDLCCGNLGQALILHQVGHFLDDQELIEDAQQIGRAVAGRAPDSLFVPSAAIHETETWLDPGFMTGLAGVAYAFIRLSRPSLANLMLLE